MTPLKHTPGPWRIVKRANMYDPALEAGITIWGEDRDVVSIEFPHDECCDPKNEIPKANARLIAAAPEMLEALKGIAELLNAGTLVRNTDDDHKSDFAVRMVGIVQKIKAVKDAIDKAEGNNHA